MKKNIVTGFIIFILFTIHNCAIKPIPETGKEPEIRVGIMEGLSSIEFRTGDGFEVFSYDGNFLMTGSAGDRCLIEVLNGNPAKIIYLLLVKTAYDEQAAQKTVTEINAEGFSAIIKKRWQKMLYKGRFEVITLYHICLDKEFDTQENAESYKRNIDNKFALTVMPYMKDLPTGMLRLKNLNNGQTAESKSYLQIIGNSIILNVSVGTGFHFEGTETRTYKGRLNFVVDRYGKLTVVNELLLEDYLAGVVSSEMHPDFPLEALKAQAVTARGFTLSRLGKQHPLDPFDLCDDVHCQVFSGITKVSQNTVNAVRDTKGKVLMYQEEICETFYSSVCGGHTEHNENVWQGTPKRYLRGIFDLPQEKVTVDEDFLLYEPNVRRWVEKQPNVYCNINLIDSPPYLEYTRKYFHWEVAYSQTELRQIIKEKIDEDVGQVLDISPLKRGISGRLIKIEIKGTMKSLTIEKELEIRRLLSHNYLYSSCFIIDKVGDVQGVPQRFIIKGAGWGHGVGMCQTGAAVMALKRMDYQQILRHYFRGSKIESLY